MNVSPLCRIVGASLLGLAVQAAVAQSRPPTTEQLGRDPGALRQEAEKHLKALQAICLVPCEELDELKEEIERYRRERGPKP
jgi:hypothetical protein